ncbi:membrane protein [Pullulanibacillus camelliae]|uniref:Membrane protein n=1 Tax=Pullulanibacillus camelliae TaxID=1707096 RepID=A0A8J2VRZ7_9BACL|nr:DMT family transporter [Pullulanibacillus camelliae]GGE36826.1 membrane protein [Pullulanibacillus camelliae]
MSNKNKGILLLLASAFGFAMMAVFVKLSGDLPTVQKTLFRNLVSAVVAFGFVLYHKERVFGRKENQVILILRSTFGTLGILLNFYAIDHLILSDSEMLNKLSPFLLIIFSALFLKEKVKPYQWLCVIVALVGALFIIKPEFSAATIPYAFGFLGSVFAAGAYTFLRVLGNKEKYYTVVFYFSFFATVVLLPFTIYYYEPMSLKQLVYLLLAGVFATIGQFGITLAYKFAPASEISVFFYSTVLYSTILSIVIFKQWPDGYSLIGYACILAALIYMFIRNNQRSKEAAS